MKPFLPLSAGLFFLHRAYSHATFGLCPKNFESPALAGRTFYFWHPTTTVSRIRPKEMSGDANQ